MSIGKAVDSARSEVVIIAARVLLEDRQSAGMAEDSTCPIVGTEIGDMQDIELILLSDKWCFGVRILRSWREAGEPEIWYHEFEMGFELRDALDLPDGATFTTVHIEQATVLSNRGGLPAMYGATINGFEKAGADLQEYRKRMEQVYPMLLIKNRWS